MTWWDAAFLAAAGVVGGLTGSIAGLASIATYPALLLVGLPPVTANVTNTVALVFNGIGSVSGSRPELEGQGAWLKRIVPVAAVGAVIGAALLLTTPAEGFEKSVPVLLALASVAIVIPRTATRDRESRRSPAAHCHSAGRDRRDLSHLYLRRLLRRRRRSASRSRCCCARATPHFAHANAAKNVIAGVANSVAALIFVFLAPVHWPAVVALGLGCLVGSRLGPIVVRHAPAGPLRVAIGAAGLALAIKLGIDAYG